MSAETESIERHRGKVERIHGTAGNRRIEQLAKRGELPIAQAGSAAERAANRAAGQLTKRDNQADESTARHPAGRGAVNRPPVEETAPPSVAEPLAHSGRPLPSSVKPVLEEAFDDRFSTVRIHTGSRADDAAKSIDARAFAVDEHLVFRSREYDPRSPAGMELLAHELAHVTQQAGPEPLIQRQTEESMTNQDDTETPTQSYTFEPMHIQARKPRDIGSIADDIVEFLDSVWFTEQPGMVALRLKFKFQEYDLTDSELMDVLQALRQRGRLADVLEYIHVSDFKEYLQSKGVPWDFVFTYYDPGITAGAQVFAGFVAGIGEDLYDVVHLIYMLTGSMFSEELAQQRSEFVDGLKQLLSHPVVTAQEGFEQMRETFKERLYNLNFFGAGRMVAHITMAVIDAAGAVKALPRAASAVARSAASVGRMTIRAIEDLGVSIRALIDFATNPRPQMVTANGFRLNYVQQDILVTTPRGEPAGKIARDRVLQSSSLESSGPDVGISGSGGSGSGGTEPSIAEASPTPREFEAGLEETRSRARETPEQSPDAPRGPRIDSLEDLVSTAINNVRDELGTEWLPASGFGTKLHSELETLVRRHLGSANRLTIHAERPIDEFGHVSQRVKGMTIEEYVDLSPVMSPYKSLVRQAFGGLDSRVGAKKPDLVIQASGETIVWDLTSRSRSRHLVKTMFYADVLRRSGDLARVGETYWRHFSEGFDPFSYYSVSGARRASEAGQESE